MGERVVLVDDLDGTEGDVQKVYFSLGGSSYEIDLNAGNVERLNSALAPFIHAARPGRPNPGGFTGASRRGRLATEVTPRVKTERDYDLTDLREWAAARGVEVPKRGRIAAPTVEQYKTDAAWHGRER